MLSKVGGFVLYLVDLTLIIMKWVGGRCLAEVPGLECKLQSMVTE